MKILIFNSVRLWEVQPQEVSTFEDVTESLNTLVGKLESARNNRASWQVGFDPKFNVDYTIVNERLETLRFDYPELYDLRSEIEEFLKCV